MRHFLTVARLWFFFWMACLQWCGSVQAEDHKEIHLTTKDGVEISATYYPSSLGEQAVPVVLLHDFKESQARFEALAKALQNPSDPEIESKAVITVDLRGHGKSLVQHGRGGQSRKLDAARLGQAGFRNMVSQDMEAVRKFLVTENDARRLNLNKLCLLGVGMGANVATTWAAVDWSAPPLAIRKQGQDVKGLVLISPEWKHRGLPLLGPLQQPGVQKRVSVMIAYGDRDSKAKKSAQTVYKNLKKHRPDPPRDEVREKKNLYIFPLPTRLQGTKLLTVQDFKMLQRLEIFIERRLSDKDFSWIRRRETN